MGNLVTALYDAAGNQIFDPNNQQRGNAYTYVGIWSRRPLPVAALAGAQMCITDVPVGGRSFWWCDGTYWKPVNGRVSLYNQNGGYTTPLAFITWASAAILIALPGGSVKIPGGMIIPGQTELRSDVLWVCGANTGGVNAQKFLGSGNSLSDSQLLSNFVGANNEWDQIATITFPTTTLAAMAAANTGKTGAPAGALGAEFSTNINTAVDMFLNYGTTNGSTNGNTLKIARLAVELVFP